MLQMRARQRVGAEAPVVRLGRALAHPLRVRVLRLLLDNERQRAGVLARRCHVALPLMKQHLLRLQQAQLICAERIDNAVYYRLSDLPATETLRPLLQEVPAPPEPSRPMAAAILVP